MMDSSSRRYCFFKKLASFRRLLCTSGDESDSPASRDESLPRHIPTHAAASFLKTATPASLRQALNRTHALDSSKTSLEVSHGLVIEQATYRLETIPPSPTTPDYTAISPISSQNSLHKPLDFQLPSRHFDVAYPSLGKRTEKTKGRGNKKTRAIPRDSLIMNRRNFANHSEIWRDA